MSPLKFSWQWWQSLAEPDSSLKGQLVVVTAGGTREALDPVRYLGNRSSGKMGNALALAALERGADVVLITTTTPPLPDERLSVVQVDSAQQMHDAVFASLAPHAVLIMAAAVADYRPKSRALEKLKKSAKGMTLELVPTVDILKAVATSSLRDDLFVVGFAAETQGLIDSAVAKLRDKRLDLIVANDVSRSDIGMGSNENEVTVVSGNGIAAEVSRAPKLEVARAILDCVSRFRAIRG